MLGCGCYDTQTSSYGVFLEKEEIQMKETGDSEVSSKVQTKMAGRKEDLLSSEEKSLFYVV